MSMYGDDSYGNEKNNLFDEMREFLLTHPIEELIHIVADSVEYHAFDVQNGKGNQNGSKN